MTGHSIPSCQHRSLSDEAVSIDATGREKWIEVHLCNWPEGNPDKFVDAPRWIQKQVYPGLAITPEIDCINCPARLP